MWVEICFDTAGELNKPSYLLEYGGYQIEIIRGSTTKGHNLCIEIDADNSKVASLNALAMSTMDPQVAEALSDAFREACKEAHEAGHRFLSELAWLFDTRVVVLGSSHGEWKSQINVSNMTFSRLLSVLNLDDYKQIAFSRDQQIALGIYRQGVSSNSIFYAFLCYSKVINIKCLGRKAHMSWINNNIHKISNDNIINTINKLKKNGIVDIGEHLYMSGRCAIAHASLQSGEPIADADNYDDQIRIARDLPIAKALARVFICEELNVPDGFQFRKILG
jgi:hypothetical protein